MRRITPAALSLALWTALAVAQSDVVKPRSFVFSGTVESVGSLTSVDAGATVETVMVKLDTSVTKGTFTMPAGTVVRVHLEGDALLKQGDRLQFRTDALSYGELITLHGEVGPAPSRKTNGGLQTLQSGADSSGVGALQPTLQKKVDNADLVVLGKVKRVRSLASERKSALSALGQRAVSEHDKNWKEAEIEVTSVAKGDAGIKMVTVVFPGTMDSLWSDYQKLDVKDPVRVYFLHKDQIPDPQVRGALLMTVVPPESLHHGGTYTALQFADVASASTFAAVRKAARHQ